MLSSTMSNEAVFSSLSVCTSIPANLNNFIGIMVERTQLLSFVSHNLLKKELTAYLLLPGKIYNLSGIRSIILPPQDLNLSALPSVPIIWTIRTSRQISKKTEATSNVDAVPFSHTRARILQIWYKSGILHQRLPSETMDAILLFNANFKTYANHVIQKLF